ncbi:MULTISPECIES: diguanylate cyclase [unclassified Bacillus (in: firmicutes)]|uniref:diguanylate cyclase n=1 Tax=unclassified Bacillus (in: firmicutes) TaxID=185979 RepID=UPI0008E2E105|nr:MULTISPECIES: diguanylate cyclase [unclassified Bacillus (in: firmicutes)]SFA81089.1 diguanylate cyclase (GGDEF) domain-containing protein [Bacillus sp. UNCCL13]SFQ71223.1 diguanylate cyclase (GGDEF) domain-containing protein [Bacillus sp. cl95]
MELHNYERLLFQKIKRQISDWFASVEEMVIPKEDVYGFLHSIKGTAGTIELGGLFQMASNLLESIEKRESDWSLSDLRDFLYDLMNLTYEYEHFQELDSKPKVERNAQIPLIQIIDTDISMLILLKDVLEEKGWMVITSSNLEKAKSQYYEFHPDLIILDGNLPDNGGLQFLNDLETHTSKHFVPKMIMSAQNDRQLRIDSYRSGGDDFVAKPIDSEEFIVRVERHLQRKRLFDESVLTDELTNVYNRRYLSDVLDRNLKDFKRTKEPFSIVLADLDHFKKINDTHGHLIGDRVLLKFAEFLRESTRSSDTVFRYGGEEFAIILPRTRNEEAKSIMKRILRDFSKISFEGNDDKFTVTFSAGIFEINVSDLEKNDVLKFADQALYKAKESGRSKVESASDQLHYASTRKLSVSIVDDDAIIRTILLKVIQNIEVERTELDVKAFEDGISFFESGRFEESEEHFLILDGVMPVMDGLEVLQKVKKIQGNRNLYVLMLTGRKGDMDIARALKLGADDYVTKPFSITELQARIQRLIKRMK